MLNNQEISSPVLIEDLGMIFVSEKSKQKTRHAIYECPICKKHFKANVNNVNYGKTTKCRKCGTPNRGGIRSHQWYMMWANEKHRCNSETSRDYHNYGGRGIYFSHEFNFFEDWLEYVSKLPNAGEKYFTIDRIDNSIGYYKGNLRWASKSTQAYNRRKNHNSSSNYRGVYYRKSLNKWASRMTLYGIVKTIGVFDDEVYAAMAYDTYLMVYGSEAIRNFP